MIISSFIKEDLHNLDNNITEKISKQNKIPVTLGGEHGITYGAVNGIFKGLDLRNKDDIGKIVPVKIKESNRSTLFGEIIAKPSQKVA